MSNKPSEEQFLRLLKACGVDLTDPLKALEQLASAYEAACKERDEARAELKSECVALATERNKSAKLANAVKEWLKSADMFQRGEFHDDSMVVLAFEKVERALAEYNGEDKNGAR